MKAKRLLVGAVLVLLAACGRSASHVTTATTQGKATTTTAVTSVPADVSADIGAAESDMTGVDGDLGAADQDLSTDEPDPTR